MHALHRASAAWAADARIAYACDSTATARGSSGSTGWLPYRIRPACPQHPPPGIRPRGTGLTATVFPRPYIDASSATVGGRFTSVTVLRATSVVGPSEFTGA